ncbi:hypothetical protein DOS67_04905 [Staphylococcus felis]|nr:hypothetical protein DOS67_04905 [Staphylococcus felis]
MKLLMYGLNILNYIVLLLLIILNSHNLQHSMGILIISLVIYFFKKKEIFLVSVFINFFNIAIIFPILLVLLF